MGDRAHSNLSPDTVYVRLRSIVSTGIIYETDREMAFFEDTTSIVLGKPEIPQRRRVLPAGQWAVPSLAVTPNPVSQRAHVTLRRAPGTRAMLRVVDLLGRDLGAVAWVTADTDGVAEIDLDVSDLLTGLYAVVASGNDAVETARFEVLR